MLDSIRKFIVAMWFCVVLLPTIALGTFFFVAILILMMDTFMNGYSNVPVGFKCFQIISIPFLLTNLLFRRCYEMIDKLYPFSIFALSNLFILALSEWIMSYGYEVVDTARHVLTLVAIPIQILLCRIVMGFYFKKYPFN